LPQLLLLDPLFPLLPLAWAAVAVKVIDKPATSKVANAILVSRFMTQSSILKGVFESVGHMSNRLPCSA
jgi:hypothetical protein